MPEPDTMISSRLRRWMVPGVALLANLAVLWAPELWVRGIGIWVLGGLVPGLLAARLLLPDEDDPLIVGLATAGLGYAALIWGGLLLHYVPGPIPRWLVLAAYDALALALWAWEGWRPSPPRVWRVERKQVVAVVALVAIAAAFRLPSLGYSEFQGDEVAVLTRAAGAVQGTADVLFLHKKGPAEILLSAMTYAASRNVSEGLARFPFTLANLLGVVGLYALGERFFSRRAGMVAALLMALNGFYVAFGRIVQYQSLVFLFSVLGLYWALRFAERPDRRHLWLSALFLASGLLAHTDGAFAAAASALVILRALIVRRVPLPTIVRWLWGPILVAGVSLATFFVPAALHPYSQTAREYLQARVGQPPQNNLYHFLTIGTAYNAVYYLALMALAMLWIAAARLWRIGRPRWLLPFILLAFLALSIAFPKVWIIGSRDAIGVFFTVFVFVILFCREESLAWQGAWVWFGLPFLMYAFWFADPRTHVYIVFPGAALLCGAELERVWPALKAGRWVVSGVGAGVLLVSSVYLYVAFVSHTPEYKRTYPQHRIGWFWMPTGDSFPKTGLFGFPYRAGWKVVGALYASGVLQGDYTSNEEALITNWYVRQPYACDNNSRYFFTAENVQDVHDVTFDEDHFVLVGQIWVGGEAKIRMYEHRPVQLPYRDYHTEDPAIVRAFDQQYSQPEFATELRWSIYRLQEAQHRQQLRLGSSIEFLGYSVDKAQVRPGESLRVTLYWRAVSSVDTVYTRFTHVEGGGRVWAQKDQAFCYTKGKTWNWAPGEVIVDHHVMVLRPDTPAGRYALVGGMYRTDNQEPVSVTDLSGAVLGTTLDLGAITVVTP